MAGRFANRSIPFLSLLLLIVFLFFFSSSLTCIDAFEHETNNNDGSRDLDFDVEDGGGHEVMPRWENDDDIRRRALGILKKSNSRMVLAAKRTLRRDLFNKFRFYRGGWNVTNKHYWLSVGSSAFPLLVVAAVWLVGFAIALLVTCCCFCCCERKPASYSRHGYAISLACLTLFTIAAVIGCIFLFTGEGSFFRSTNRTLQYILSQGRLIGGKLQEVGKTFSKIKTIGIDRVTVPPELVTYLDKGQRVLDKVHKLISEHVEKFSKMANKYSRIGRLYSYILPGVMLILAFLGFVLAVFGLECLVYTLVILGWILVALTFVLCGAFLAIHNVVGDSCGAVGEWLQNPQAHTALDDVLPCLDKSITDIILTVSKGITLTLVNMVDVGIASVANDQGLLNYNQSGPYVPYLCRPYNIKDLSNRTCEEGEVEIGHASEMLKNYVCEAKEEGERQICVTTGRLTPRIYTQMDSTLNVSNLVYLYTPFFLELTDCTFVRKTFRDIHQIYCPLMEKYTRQLYICLLTVSLAVMLSLIFWIIFSNERKHRIHAKKRAAHVVK